MSDVPGRSGRLGPRGLTRRVWAIAFGYSVAAALLVQLVVLPYLLPSWHGGHGLLAGGDWLTFHHHAVEAAERIRTEGWGAFRLRPLSHTPVGIASAIYALTWPEPWTLIPLHAALHATAAALLFHLLRGYATDWRWAALGTGPFLLYPSALMWVSQIHKDGFSIAAYLCLFAAWSDLAWEAPGPGAWRTVPRALLLLPAGFGLAWLVRPDLIVAVQAAAAIALGVLAIAVAARIWQDPSHWRRRVAILALIGLTTLASAWATHESIRVLRSKPTSSGNPPGPPTAVGGSLIWAGDPVPHPDGPVRPLTAIAWYPTPWLPAAVDRLAYRIALTREGFLIAFLDGRTNLDVGVGFHSAAHVLRYVPRALQIGLLAPFPTQWRQRGSLAWTTATRRVVAIEMLGVYVGLLGLAAAVWRRWRHADLWVVLLPCLALLTLYCLVVPNLGALHRFRYGFLMVLVGIGITGGLEQLAGVRRRVAGRRDRATRWVARGKR